MENRSNLAENPFNGTIEHTGFVVPDIEEAVDFFTQILGFEVLLRPQAMSFEDDRLTRYFGVYLHSKVVGAAFLQYGGKKIELVQWEAPGQQRTVQNPGDVGVAHLALTVSNLDAAINFLRSKNVLIREFCPIGFIYISTPWGMEIQLMQQK